MWRWSYEGATRSWWRGLRSLICSLILGHRGLSIWYRLELTEKALHTWCLDAIIINLVRASQEKVWGQRQRGWHQTCLSPPSLSCMNENQAMMVSNSAIFTLPCSMSFFLCTAGITNGCAGNHGCSHHCLLRPNGAHGCACPTGVLLKADQKTCENGRCIFLQSSLLSFDFWVCGKQHSCFQFLRTSDKSQLDWRCHLIHLTLSCHG